MTNRNYKLQFHIRIYIYIINKLYKDIKIFIINSVFVFLLGDEIKYEINMNI